MSKIKLCVVTGTRAEYGLLFWTMKKISQDPDFTLQIIATGMHLSPEFGNTYTEILKDGFQIDKKIEMLMSSDTSVGISKSMGLGMISFCEVYEELKPDLILVLGDRFEIFSAVSAAMISKIPIAHCHGGEATVGLIDEPIRHSITKMSHFHFTSTEEYKNRVIQLGEHPEKVYNVGALGIENINKLELLSKEDFEKSISFKLGNNKIALVTFHPVTLENSTSGKQMKELLDAISDFQDMKVIFTKANSDTDGRIINEMIDNYVAINKNVVGFASLGQLRYLSALKYVDIVIGNSSSGLIEVPSFNKPTVNIGDRQMNRIKADSVIDCEPIKEKIIGAVQLGLSNEFSIRISNLISPYGTGNSSEQIINAIKSIDFKDKEKILKKEFYDLK